MKKVYNPGCALMLYKPHYSGKVLSYLNSKSEVIEVHNICCRHEPKLPRDSVIINTCAGCDNRFGSLYDGITTVSLWEIMAKDDGLTLPDYKGLNISVHDACPVRGNERVHEAIRVLLRRMNVNITEADKIRTKSVCCGDTLYKTSPIEDVHDAMKSRAGEMPCENVAVYCISCIHAMYKGGKSPRYMLDLIFNEPTEEKEQDIQKWHEKLDRYIELH